MRENRRWKITADGLRKKKKGRRRAGAIIEGNSIGKLDGTSFELIFI